MIRFIDLRGQIDIYNDDQPLDKQVPHFAFFDTGTSTFLTFNDSQEWHTQSDFVEDFTESQRPDMVSPARGFALNRFLRLMPEWVK